MFKTDGINLLSLLAERLKTHHRAHLRMLTLPVLPIYSMTFGLYNLKTWHKEKNTYGYFLKIDFVEVSGQK